MPCLFLVTAVLLLAAAPAPIGKVPRRDQDKILGTWIVVSMRMGDEPLPDAKGVKMVFTDRTLTWKETGTGNKPMTVFYQLRPTKYPKEIDLLDEELNPKD